MKIKNYLSFQLLLSWLLPAIGIFSFCLSFYSLVDFYNSSCENDICLEPIVAAQHALIGALQLFTLNFTIADMKSWQVQIASLLSPIALAGTALVAFSGRLNHYFRLKVLTIKPAKHLFLGSGQTALSLKLANSVNDIENLGKYVSVDLLENSPLKDELLQNGGGFAEVADATSIKSLILLNAIEAENVWIVSGGDKKNIQILESLIKVCELSTSKPNHTNKNLEFKHKHWFVDINNAEIIKTASSLLTIPDDVIIDYFNLERLAARRLMQNFSTHIARRYAAAELSKVQIHICIIGSDELSETILLQAITQLVTSEDPEKSIQITWIGSGVSAHYQDLIKRMPQIDQNASHLPPLSSLLPIAKINVFDTNEVNIQPALWKEIQSGYEFDSVFISNSDKLQMNATMLRVLALRDIVNSIGQEIILCHWSSQNDYESSNSQYKNVINFYALDEIISKGDFGLGTSLDENAKIINAHFSGINLSNKDEVRNKWAKAVPSNKWSSRMSADHMIIKKIIIDQTSSNNPGSSVVTADAVNELARLEHRRFIVERIVEGWIPLESNFENDTVVGSPSGKDYPEQRKSFNISKSLLPFDLLPVVEQDKNKQVIKDMLHLI